MHIEPHAVGSESGSAELYVVNGACNWGNSLHAPVVLESTFKIPVQFSPVDDVLLEMGNFPCGLHLAGRGRCGAIGFKRYRANSYAGSPARGSPGHSHAAMGISIQSYRRISYSCRLTLVRT